MAHARLQSGFGGKALLVAIVASVVVASSTWMQFQLGRRIDQLQRDWIDYTRDAAAAARTLSAIRGHIGYGGLIHNFKNYVLRHDEALRRKVEAQYEALVEDLNVFRDRFADPEDRDALRTIETTFKAYFDNRLVAQTMIRNGAGIAAIDRAVRIDDRAALAALDELARTIVARRAEQEQRTHAALARTRALLDWSTLLAPLTIAAAALMIWLIYRISKVNAGLHAAQTNLSRLIESTPDALLTVDSSGCITRTNQQAERLLGYRNDELVGQKVEILLPEGSRDGHANLRNAYVAQPNFRPMGRGVQLYFRHKSGVQIPAAISLSHLETEQGVLAIATIRDISIQKRFEAQLIAEKDRAERYLRISEALILELDRDANIVLINPRGCEILGYTAAELVGMNWLDEFVPPDVRHEVRAGFQRIMSGNSDAAEYSENSIVVRGGARVQIAWHHAARRDDKGAIVGTLSSGQDISERYYVETLKDEFVSTVSHEIRTPLTSIKGSLDLISKQAAGQVPHAVTPLLEVAQRNAQRLLRLINDLLDVQQFASGKMQFQLREIEVRRFLQRAVSDNQPYAHQFDVRLELHDPEDDIRIHADADRLMQVMNNLISNAVKFSPKGGTVFIGAERADALVRFAVRDQGPGIPEEFRQRVFERFAQAEQSSDKKVYGSGLGLNIARSIVMHHRGEMSFETETGQGTTFHFTLPVSRVVSTEEQFV
jgi:PAS domain S-box-containing protein